MKRKPSRKHRPNRRRHPARRPSQRQPTGDDVWVVSALDGVQDIVRSELENRLRKDVTFLPHARTDEIHFRFSGPPSRLIGFRTPQTLHIRRDFDVARPRTLLSPEHLNAIHELVQHAGQIGSPPVNGFRFDAAGSGSPTMQRLSEALSERLSMRYNRSHGDCVITLRPGRKGWEVLCRVGNRPLATRSWREVNYRGSLNAPIAACMVEMTKPKPGDRYLNFMCGSGTLMIERLLRLRARTVVGVDNEEKALSACRENVEAAGYSDHIEIIDSNAQSIDLPDGSFNVITSDLPYGEKLGSRRSNVELYTDVLREADRLCRTNGRIVLISQDIGALTSVLETMEDRLQKVEERRIVQRDFRPLCVSLRKK